MCYSFFFGERIKIKEIFVFTLCQFTQADPGFGLRGVYAQNFFHKKWKLAS